MYVNQVAIMYKPFVAILLLFFTKCEAQEVFHNRTCESYKATVVQNLNLTKYSGVWHVLSRYYHKREKNWDCVIANYTSIGEYGLKLKVTGKNLNTSKEHSYEANLYEKYPQYHEGNLGAELDGKNSTYTVLVIGTDYNNYAVLWGCENVAPNNNQLLWVLSRATVLDANSSFEIATVLENSHLDSTRLQELVSDPKKCGCKKHNSN